ncbi:MAG: transcription antitermination factor NusB, partial [Bacteroidia bacterium]|nr:transcription antitermination factor NusB [Bacteroidia bacterium]
MQSLYSFFQHEKANAAQFEKELFKSLDKIHDLYFHILALLVDFHHIALVIIDENKNKMRPNAEDLDPNLKFVKNTLLVELSENKELKAELVKRKISWQNDFDVVRKLFNDIRAGEEYKAYLSEKTNSIQADRDYVISLITNNLAENEVLLSLFEEKNIHWVDDSFVAFNSVIRNLEEFNGTFKLQALLKDEKDDLDFMSLLFNKTILYHQQFEELIDKHTQNWELERIANMDRLLMEMALAEILYIPSVPVKASLNEYIDISKEYSTPNS